VELAELAEAGAGDTVYGRSRVCCGNACHQRVHLAASPNRQVVSLIACPNDAVLRQPGST